MSQRLSSLNQKKPGEHVTAAECTACVHDVDHAGWGTRVVGAGVMVRGNGWWCTGVPVSRCLSVSLSVCTRCHSVSQCLHPVSQCLSVYYPCLSVYYRVLPCITEYYRVLPSITELLIILEYFINLS